MSNAKIRHNFHQARWDEPIIYELSTPGARGILVPEVDEEVRQGAGDVLEKLPSHIRRKGLPPLPEMSQKHVLGHYLRLSQETLGCNITNDLGEGTCTMKYNPRINEWLAALPELAEIHPLQPEETVQGILEIYYNLERCLKEISGMEKFSLQPGGGNHAAYTAAAIIRKYFQDKGEWPKRNEIITTIFSHPSAASTPATAGFKVITIYPDENGYPDFAALQEAVSERTAALFITNPEDIGLYNPHIDEYVNLVHSVGGICYYDQANANAVLGVARAKEAGFDMCHFNLHKTFGAPHGGYGPGSGALGCINQLSKYLPTPTIEFNGQEYYLDYTRPHSIGKVRGFYGTTSVILKSYAWIMALGGEGLRECSDISVINNNYLQKKLEQVPGLSVVYGKGHRRFEQIRYSWDKLNEDTGITTEEISNRLADYGIEHYWTSHHPWIVPEPMTLEPCESYSKDDIDEFAEVLGLIAQQAYDNPQIVKNAPHKLAIRRRSDESWLDYPEKWAVTWRGFLKKHKK